MPRHWHARSSLALLVAGALLALSAPLRAPGTTAAAAAVSRAPASGCAAGHPLDAPLQLGELALIKRFVLCIGKQWPGPAARRGHFVSLGGPPAVVRVLNGFAAGGRADETSRFITSRLSDASLRINGHPYTLGTGCFTYALWDTSPPGIPSLAVIERSFDQAYATLVRAIGRQANFVPTTAVVERGSWFHDGSTDNVRLAVVFAGSPLTPIAHCPQ